MTLRNVLVAGLVSLLTASAATAQDGASPPALSRIGAINKATSYVFQFVPAELGPDKHPYGGNIAEAWIYARLFTASGKRYILMRTVKEMTSAGVTLEQDGKPDSRLKKESVAVTRTVDPATGLNFKGKGFDIRLSPDAVSWSDQDGAIKISGSGSPLGKVGTAEMIPYLKKDGGTGMNIYTGQYQPVSGTVFGEAVTGMFVIDHFIGTEYFGESSLANNEVAWFKFANVFEDNSVEMGEFFIEHPAFHGAAVIPAVRGGSVTDGIRVIASGDPQLTIELGADGKTATRETWTIGKDQWVWTPDQLSPGRFKKMTQAYGGVRRVGDDRKIVNQFAIVEYVVDNLADSPFVTVKK